MRTAVVILLTGSTITACATAGAADRNMPTTLTATTSHDGNAVYRCLITTMDTLGYRLTRSEINATTAFISGVRGSSTASSTRLPDLLTVSIDDISADDRRVEIAAGELPSSIAKTNVVMQVGASLDDPARARASAVAPTEAGLRDAQTVLRGCAPPSVRPGIGA